VDFEVYILVDVKTEEEFRAFPESIKPFDYKPPITSSVIQDESLDNHDWNLVEKLCFKEELNAAERRYNADCSRLEARLEREVQKVAQATAYTTKVQSPLDSAPVFWDVAKGRTLDSRGVYPSWEVCRPRVHGVHNSVFDEFNTERDAWKFVCDNIEVDSNPTPDGTPRISPQG
jgi:hypothetical protein